MMDKETELKNRRLWFKEARKARTKGRFVNVRCSGELVFLEGFYESVEQAKMCRDPYWKNLGAYYGILDFSQIPFIKDEED